MQQRKTNVGSIRMHRKTRRAISVFCEALSDQNPSSVHVHDQRFKLTRHMASDFGF
ncbi:hypothetical protein JHK82_045642 [Glycine max]|nr:hypothetical protein JHK86_043974 [Glycine max]KAG4950692.1 hypothetical protein JHK85_044559 [Glycine max]KAG5100590.1 hypothetical protein JHK82_045642 [Glycine max]KHN39689.1 hypothetical protein glysoja_020767 [Glycine soja]